MGLNSTFRKPGLFFCFFKDREKSVIFEKKIIKKAIKVKFWIQGRSAAPKGPQDFY